MSAVFRWILPIEALLLAGLAIIILLYDLFGLPMPGQPGRFGSYGPLYFYLKQLITALDLYSVVWIIGTGITFLLLGLKKYKNWGPGERAHQFFSKRLTLPEILLDIRFLNAVLLMFVEFACLKHLIPHINPTLFDEQFLASERFICNGMLCAEHLHALLGKSAVPYVERHYIWYFPYMTLVLLAMIVQPKRSLTNTYCTAFVFIFIFGVLAVYAAPTLGPIYIEPNRFSILEGSEMRLLQKDLWDMKEYLAANPGSRDAVYMISGFPSLHVAVALLGTFYLFKVNFLLGILSAAFCLLITHATIFLGWHYVLDDVGSLLLVMASVPLAVRVSRQWHGGFRSPPRADAVPHKGR